MLKIVIYTIELAVIGHVIYRPIPFIGSSKYSNMLDWIEYFHIVTIIL